MKFRIRDRPSAIPRTVSVDPGVNGTGYAIWEGQRWRKLCAPITSGTLSSREEGWRDRAMEIADMLKSLCDWYNVTAGIIELPQFMEGGVGSIAARSGDLVKLTMTAGIVVGVLNLPMTFVTPNQWKGTMPKELSTSRILERLDSMWKPTSKYDHEIDAVGIGLFAKGCF